MPDVVTGKLVSKKKDKNEESRLVLK